MLLVDQSCKYFGVIDIRECLFDSLFKLLIILRKFLVKMLHNKHKILKEVMSNKFDLFLLYFVKHFVPEDIELGSQIILFFSSILILFIKVLILLVFHGLNFQILFFIQVLQWNKVLLRIIGCILYKALNNILDYLLGVDLQQTNLLGAIFSISQKLHQFSIILFITPFLIWRCKNNLNKILSFHHLLNTVIHYCFSDNLLLLLVKVLNAFFEP